MAKAAARRFPNAPPRVPPPQVVQRRPSIPSSLPALEHALVTLRETSQRLNVEADTIAKYIKARRDLEAVLERQSKAPAFPVGSIVYRPLDRRDYRGKPPRTFLVQSYDPISNKYTVENTFSKAISQQLATDLAQYIHWQ